MTEEGMGPCSPAERGPHATGCAVLRLVHLGVDVSHPLACSLPVAGLNWKAQCGESRMLRLEGGKGREALPILTPCENHS